MQRLELQTNTSAEVVAHAADVTETKPLLALVSAGGFTSDVTDEAAERQPKTDVCMGCGEWRAVAGYSFYWYWEDALRGSFVPLCEDCDVQERIRIERNRRRRRR